MPGYDGKGPTGAGPLTGTGRGYCVLKMPETQDDKPIGFAGLAGSPITGAPVFLRIETAHLSSLVRQIQSSLNNLNNRIDIFKRSSSRDGQN